ncbi:Os04g0586332 [Oryza sativa Japonica Group]|uniref:Os04g0586332 protein n=1 Tax=Oryza sativa subsp. japonica TaxID=39947 RepID=A0A0P0WE03_ORYSJ|nr:Os04g0586332 [Oryza sativa Japonica Group]
MWRRRGTEVVALGEAALVWRALVVMEVQEGEGIGDGGEEGLADVRSRSMVRRRDDDGGSDGNARGKGRRGDRATRGMMGCGGAVLRDAEQRGLTEEQRRRVRERELPCGEKSESRGRTVRGSLREGMHRRRRGGARAMGSLSTV